MKTIVWLLCLSWLFTGCGATVKAVPSKKKRVVVVEQLRHKHPKKRVVVVVGSRVKKRPPKSVVIYYRDIPYLYADGVYYKAVDDVYEALCVHVGEERVYEKAFEIVCTHFTDEELMYRITERRFWEAALKYHLETVPHK